MTQASFPFDLLHAEIINYAKESEGRRNAAKQEWKQNSYITQLESMGYRVGYVMAERVSKEAPKLLTELE
ncbi:hypothetical protein ANCDUO_20819, partial [Ancylostoma duodenale]